jgi:hypothetical protein
MRTMTTGSRITLEMVQEGIDSEITEKHVIMVYMVNKGTCQ